MYPKAVIRSDSDDDVFVFSPEELFDLETTEAQGFWGPPGGPRIRLDGNFRGKAFYLDPAHDWVVATDDLGNPILIPVRK